MREASYAELDQISRERGLSLSAREMKLLQEYYKKIGRDATDVELEAIAQTWSEHCGHKTFKGSFALVERDERGREKKSKVDNLFKTYIARATRELALPWCYSVFEDNAGIVDFDGDNALAFKVETHNHPSALEPFGGAATGVGGVIRDVLGVWADPIANTDVLCFGPLDLPEQRVPSGVKHPRFLYNGVVAGIACYGNNMGIPTVNGAIFFHENYTGNPLVYCGTLGLLKKSAYKHEAAAGDALVLVGGRTGRDGIHGVTFASAGLHEKSEETSRTAVQIGDPIEEEKVKRGILQVRDAGLANAITDLGGGGLSSAVAETAERYSCGVRVDLSLVPQKYPLKTPWEIWVSESQERMLLAVPQRNVEAVKKIFEDELVLATVVGELTAERNLRLFYKNVAVADIDMNFLFTQPTTAKGAVLAKTKPNPLSFNEPASPQEYGVILKKILSSPNVCSKESVVRRYDHEVKGSTTIKPFQGASNEGPGDAAVIRPLRDSWKGAALSNGFNSLFASDAYKMAASAIDEAIRNNVCVGGRRWALLDNFSWGNPNDERQAGGLVAASRACYDYALAFRAPFISGKDSLHNECNGVAIPQTLLVSALGIVPDVRKAITMDAKKTGNYLYIVGETKLELGGSHYCAALDASEAGVIPGVDGARAATLYEAVLRAMDAGLVRSCHDCSEGGMAVAAAEMGFAGGLGVEIDLTQVPRAADVKRNDFVLFSESNSRLLIEVEPDKAKEFEASLKGITFGRIGVFTQNPDFVVKVFDGTEILRENVFELKRVWQKPLKR